MMSYSGGMLPRFHGDLKLAKETFAFLKRALQHVKQEKPFRGPEIFRELDEFGDNKFTYLDDNNGDITNFERIRNYLKNH